MHDCKYYRLVDGHLQCSVCQKRLDAQEIEDKLLEKPEDKERANVRRNRRVEGRRR